MDEVRLKKGIQQLNEWLIMLDGENIGFLYGNFRYFDYIKLQRKYRGKGYARKAIKLYVDKARESGVSKMKTTKILNQNVKNTLLDLGFQPCENSEDIYEFYFK